MTDDTHAARATDQAVYWCYRILLRREPDADGLSHFRRLVAAGLSVDELIGHFIQSEEYREKQRVYQREMEARGEPVAVDLGGYQVVVRRTDLDFGSGIFESRRYEDHVRQVVRDLVEPGDVVVDVGANVGVIALLAASLVQEEGQVVAVEPNPDNVQLLYRGIVLNGYQNITVLPFAASGKRAIFSLTGGTSNTHIIGANATHDGHLAQSIVLDEALSGLSRLDFVKMDIEGHEPLALEGARALLKRHKPTLLIEFNPRCLDIQQCDPAKYVSALLEIHSSARAISSFGDDFVFERPDQLLQFWTKRDREIAALGLLPKGMLHFDLIATAG
jgi:FkbM family methyltransferase